jgi:hypothetical protein
MRNELILGFNRHRASNRDVHSSFLSRQFEDSRRRFVRKGYSAQSLHPKLLTRFCKACPGHSIATNWRRALDRAKISWYNRRAAILCPIRHFASFSGKR